MNKEDPILVRVRNLVKHFPQRGGLFNRVVAKVHAVNDVSFDIEKGKTLGVVGESGCGKSTLGKLIIRLHDATSGEVTFDGLPLGKRAIVKVLLSKTGIWLIPVTVLIAVLLTLSAHETIVAFSNSANRKTMEEILQEDQAETKQVSSASQATEVNDAGANAISQMFVWGAATGIGLLGTVGFLASVLAWRRDAHLAPIRRRMQMIFQDPNSSLNPRMTVGATIAEVLKLHQVVPVAELDTQVDSLLEKVGLRPDDKRKYPHEFSGGQKQRIGIARALAVNPEFIIADEPVSALDVSIQAQVLNLMMDLKEELGLTLLFVSHDLKVIDHFCDSMLVMYLGKVVEEVSCEDIHATAKHPYTKALLACNPITDPQQRSELQVLEGEVPSPYQPPVGCPFFSRCPMKVDRCETENPPLMDHGDGHRVACWEISTT